MRNEWSLTLSGERTPRLTQPARGMFLRRSKVWRNGRDGSYMISDRIYPAKKVAELGIPSSVGRNFPSNDYVIALAGPPDGIDSILLHEDTPFRTVKYIKLRVPLSPTPGCRPRSKLDLHPPIGVHSPMSTDIEWINSVSTYSFNSPTNLARDSSMG